MLITLEIYTVQDRTYTLHCMLLQRVFLVSICILKGKMLCMFRYNLVPRAMFYEFIPVDESSKDQPSTLLSDQVKEGETYELVITNNSGLKLLMTWRCCEDQPVFYKKGPPNSLILCFTFLYTFYNTVLSLNLYDSLLSVDCFYRQGQLLNVRGEKLSEEAFYRSLQKIAGSQLADYCCAESAAIKTSKETVPHYVVFVEYQNGQVMSQDKTLELDEDLRKEHFVYDSFRTKGSIAIPEVYSLKPGTFLALRQHLLQHTDATANQYAYWIEKGNAVLPARKCSNKPFGTHLPISRMVYTRCNDSSSELMIRVMLQCGSYGRQIVWLLQISGVWVVYKTH
ncbi:GH3 domain-containing protein [Penaeus vannamei]|uniref:GH3 domain-containing protein n=1 Tax=Penaeus vannamei TaxID=6689 RepID=UPI00387F4982